MNNIHSLFGGSWSPHEAPEPKPLEKRGGGDDSGGMEARVAVLEQIAKDTKETLGRIDRRLERLEDRQVADFRWLLGGGIAATLGLAALMAHGFHWL